MGPIPSEHRHLLGDVVVMTAVEYVKDDKVAAVAVVIPDKYNYNKATNLHVTVATGPGGKPVWAGSLPYNVVVKDNTSPAETPPSTSPEESPPPAKTKQKQYVPQNPIIVKLNSPITLRGVVKEVPEGDTTLAEPANTNTPTNAPTNESTVTHATFVCERWQRLAGIL